MEKYRRMYPILNLSAQFSPPLKLCFAILTEPISLNRGHGRGLSKPLIDA